MILSQSEKEKLQDLYLHCKQNPNNEKRIYYPTWPLLSRQDRLKNRDYTELREKQLISYDPWQRRTFLARILIKGEKYIEQIFVSGN
jgi:hypothetical protein